MRDLPLAARLYLVLLTLSVTVLMLTLLGNSAPLDRVTLVQATVGVVLLTVAWLYPLSLSFKQKLYLDTSVLIAAIILLPTGLVMVVAGAGTLLAHLIRRQEWVQLTFNVAQMMAQVAVGGLILVLFGDRIPHHPGAVGYVLLAGVAMYLVNSLLVATMIALQSRQSLVPMWRQAVAGVVSVEFLGHVTQIGIGALAIYLLETAAWILPMVLLPTIALYFLLRIWIRDRQATDAMRRESEAGPAEAQRVAQLGNWEWNLRTGDSFWSEETCRILGLARGATEPSYEALLRSIHPEDRVTVNRGVHDVLRGGKAFQLDHRICWPDGTQRMVKHSGEVIPDEAGGGSCLVATIRDVTEQKTLEAQLARKALQDPETGLPNRAIALDHLAELLASQRPEQQQVAIALVDIGARMAGEAGDDISLAARRLHACLREGEMVARFGITRFMVVLEASTVDDATTRAADIRDCLRGPPDLDGHNIILDVSVGVAVSNPAVKLPQDLVRAAETELASAKANIHISPVVLVPERNGVLVTETELRDAVGRRELHLYYQPEVTLAMGEIVGFEALVRWRHSTGIWLMPMDFLPLAEEVGLTIPIGHWVLEEACRTAQAWSALTVPERSLTVSVNIAREQFRDHGFVADVARIVSGAGLDPRTLRFEVTESILVEDLDASSRTMEALREMGVRFTIGDFDAGYASLGYLHQLPIDTLKLDRSLIAALETGDADRAIVQATASLARTFGLQVAATGIETPLQLAWADALGCKQGQGYLFSPPLKGEQLAELLNRTASFDSFSPAAPEVGHTVAGMVVTDLSVLGTDPCRSTFRPS